MLENDLVGHDYVEPYAGGASVALSLLYEGFADTIHINDLNPGVYAFWNAALEQTSRLCEAILKTPVTIDEWHKQRAVTLDCDASSFDLGFATFFLNRTNRSGIIGGGVIGGLDQSGSWKINARFTKPELIRRIEKVGRHRSRIHLTNADAADFLQGWASTDVPPAFLYLDPPYFLKGAGLYDNFYDPKDHAAVALKVADLQHPWIVSYDAHPEIIGLYEHHHHIRYSLSYSATTSRHRGSEVMFFSPDLALPDTLPSGVPASAVAKAQAITFGALTAT
jgi:DNA adenine methylase